MLGMVAGEERTWDFVFPDDWHVDLWRGQTATAKIQLIELFSYLLPEVRELLLFLPSPSSLTLTFKLLLKSFLHFT
jgi:hypothetical protein